MDYYEQRKLEIMHPSELDNEVYYGPNQYEQYREPELPNC